MELGLFLCLQNLRVGFLSFLAFQQPPSARIGSTPLEGAAMGLLRV
jgi:hypothetical protein